MTERTQHGDAIERVCLHCRAPAEPSHRFCGRCGARLPDRCPSCFAVVAPGQDFCTSCGRALPSDLGAAGAPREERRPVSVLFVDLIGFTELGERLDPEDLRQLQVAYFMAASGVIRRYGGIVEKYIGDAVMAVFGVPVETEHDAYRAVRAGLELQRELDDRPLAGRYGMRARVGVASGEALVDLTAARQGAEALVSGDVVATAFRLQVQAPAGSVLVSAATHRATIGTIRYGEPVRRLTLTGKSGLVEAWLAQAPARRPAIVDDEATPLVGRAHELDLLIAALRRCVQDRQAQLISVVGAHGLGKSRLVRELGRRLESAPDLLARWRVGRCLPYGEGAVYGALAEIVKAHADIQDTDDPAQARARLSTALAEIMPAGELERLTALLGPLVGLPGRPVSPGEIEAAWREVLLAMARHMPTVLVVDDLHFADPAMLRFLTALVDAATDVPLLVLCTHRPELLDEQPSWAAVLPGTLTVSLGPLRGTEMRTLVGELVSRQGLPQTLTERLATITGGNPMYAVEYVRMLGEQAAGTEIDPAADFAIPETVHGVVANRIDLLDHIERTTLHAAAVLGNSVWPGALSAMLDLPESDVGRGLRGLQRRDMLVASTASAVAGETELAFRHQLLRDVAYRRLPRPARASLHRRAAAWFEEVSADGRHDQAAAVARHRVEALRLAESLGEDTTRDAGAARRALTAAGDAAFAVYVVGPALEYVDQALTLWPVDVEPDARRTTELQRWRLEFLADSDTFYREGGVKEVARLADRMREAGQVHGEARAETLLAQAEFMRAERDRAREHLDRALDLFAGLPDDPAKVVAYSELARLNAMEYRAEDAVSSARAARELAERLGLADAAASAMVTEGIARYLTGDHSAVADLERTVDLCRAQRLPSLRRAAHNLAVALREEGELARSAQSAAESRAAYGAQVSFVPSHSEEAASAYWSGDWPTLLRAADDYLVAEDAETTEWDIQLRTRRAWIRLLCGQSPGEEFERCLDTARRSGFNRLRFNACAHGAFGYAVGGDADAAGALLGELTEVWRTGRTGATQEWLSAAVHAAALLSSTSPRVADVVGGIVGGIVGTAVRRTSWVEAAEAVVAGALATAHGKHDLAAQEYAAAVHRYDAIGSVSDAVLAAGWTARALRAAGEPASAERYAARVRAFADRNRAPGVLALMG